MRVRLPFSENGVKKNVTAGSSCSPKNKSAADAEPTCFTGDSLIRRASVKNSRV